jgi:hypothetical protein
MHTEDTNLTVLCVPLIYCSCSEDNIVGYVDMRKDNHTNSCTSAGTPLY